MGSTLTPGPMWLPSGLPWKYFKKPASGTPWRSSAGSSRYCGTIQSRAGSSAQADPTTAASSPLTGENVPSRPWRCSEKQRSSTTRERSMARKAATSSSPASDGTWPEASVPSGASRRRGSSAATASSALRGGGMASLRRSRGRPLRVRGGQLARPVLDRDELARRRVVRPADHAPALDHRRPVVGGQDEPRRADGLADGRLLGPLGAAVVARHRRVLLHDLQVRVDELVDDVVDHVAADAGDALVGVDEHVHRALGVAAGGLDANARDDLLVGHALEVEQPQRARVVQAVDEVLDVGRRVLLAHQARGGVLELAPVDDHRGAVHRELVVVARVVDVQVRVQDVADVLHLQPVLVELLLHALAVAPPALHAEVAHDGRIGEAGVDDDRRLAAEDEEAERRHLLPPAGILGEDEEARVELDVAEVEDLHFETHCASLGADTPLSVGARPRASHRTFG